MMADLLVAAVIVAILSTSAYVMYRGHRSGKHFCGCDECKCCKPNLVKIDGIDSEEK